MTTGDDSPPIDALLAQTAWIRALARSLVVDQATADDVAQDAAVIALTKPPSSAAALRAWLRRVVKNLASNARRGETRRGAREKSVAVGEAGDASDEVVARWEVRRRVVEAVLSLDEPYRATILLRFFDGLTAADAAARLGVPLETVRTRTRRGLDLLRGRLANLDDGERRRGAAVLLLLAHREGDVAGTAGAASALAKGAVMASGSKWAAGVALALIASGLTWAVATTWSPAKANVGVVASLPPAVPRVRRAPSSANAAATQQSDGVDLATCDRERDLFGDVFSADGRPVAGAVVQVKRMKPFGQLIRTAGFLDISSVAETTKSGFDGTFALRLAPREGVGLRVEAAGFATWESFYRQAGERVRVTLSPALTLVVTVTSHDGAPVAGADVSVSAEGETAGGTTFGRPHAATGPDGVVRFSGLRRSSKVFLSVTPAAHPPAMQHLTLADAAEQSLDIVLPEGRGLSGTVVDRVTGVPLAGAVVSMNWSGLPVATTDSGGRFAIADAQQDSGVSISATADGHARGRIRIRSTDTDVRIALGPAARITGRVIDADGRPVAGADVAANGTFGPVDADGGERSMGGATTGEDGRFVVDGLAADVTHAVRVQAVGSAKAVASVATPAADPWTADAGDLRLAAPRTIVAVVVDRDDRPVTRVHVVLTAAGQPRDDAFRDHRWSDDLGRLAFDGLPPGEFLLAVQADDPAWTPERVSVRVPAASDPSPVTIHLGGDPAKLKMRIPVRAKVTDDAGNAVEGVQLQVGYVANGATAAQRTGADGGAAFLAEFEPSYVSIYLDGDLAKTYQQTWIRLRPGQREFTVTLRRGRTISGKVVDDDGAPVKGGGVAAWTGAVRVGWGATDNDGRFAFSVPAGANVDLAATPQDEPRVLSRSAGELRGVTPGAEDVVIRVVRDPAPRAIDVEVVDEAGAPVAEAWIQTEFHGRDWERSPTGTTDAAGRCRIEALPRAPVLVSVTISDRAAGYNRYWTPQPVRAAAGEDRVKIVVPKPRAVTGRVVAEDGSPVAGAVVHASPNAALQGSMNIAGPDGRFTILIPPDATLPFALTGNPFQLDPAKPLSGWDIVDAEERELTIVVHPVPAR